MKTCYRCRESKPLSEFHKDRVAKDGVSAGCKPCNRARANAYRAANLDEVRARQRAAHVRNRTSRRDYQLRSKYGIDLAAYEAILSRQGGGCAICGATTDPIEGREMPVDHDHNTGEVRGVLCSTHNRAIGLFADDIGHLLKAADYLAQFVDVLSLREESLQRLETAATS